MPFERRVPPFGLSLHGPLRPGSLRPGVRSGGMTLIEILAVLAILVLMSGMSAGVYQIIRKTYALSASISGIQGLIVGARHAAMTSGVPVRVVIDPARHLAQSFKFETLGEWSFETYDELGTVTYGLSQEPAPLLEAIPAVGYVGQGIRLPSTGYVLCGDNPRFDVSAGLQVEAWIKREADVDESEDTSRRGTRRGTGRQNKSRVRTDRQEESVQAVVAKLGSFFFGVGKDGAVEASIGAYRARTDPEIVRDGRWMHISLIFDGLDIRISVNGVERDLMLDERENVLMPLRVPLSHGTTLTIGSPSGSFEGLIDEVRYRGMMEPGRVEIPPNQMVIGWKKIIHFDRRGHLDARYHDRPVRVAIYEVRPPSKIGSVPYRQYSQTYDEFARVNGLDLVGRREWEEEADIEDRYRGYRSVEVVVDRVGAVR